MGNDLEKDGSFWITQAQERLQQQLTRELNFNVAKNVIMFLGDGMSIPTLSAARAYMGRLEGSLSSGEETHLFFDDFPHTGLSKVNVIDDFFYSPSFLVFIAWAPLQLHLWYSVVDWIILYSRRP